MAGFFLLLMALGAVIAFVAILVGAYHLILLPASRTVARAYRAVVGF